MVYSSSIFGIIFGFVCGIKSDYGNYRFDTPTNYLPSSETTSTLSFHLEKAINSPRLSPRRLSPGLKKPQPPRSRRDDPRGMNIGFPKKNRSSFGTPPPVPPRHRRLRVSPKSPTSNTSDEVSTLASSPLSPLSSGSSPTSPKLDLSKVVLSESQIENVVAGMELKDEFREAVRDFAAQHYSYALHTLKYSKEMQAEKLENLLNSNLSPRCGVTEGKEARLLNNIKFMNKMNPLSERDSKTFEKHARQKKWRAQQDTIPKIKKNKINLTLHGRGIKLKGHPDDVDSEDEDTREVREVHAVAEMPNFWTKAFNDLRKSLQFMEGSDQMYQHSSFCIAMTQVLKIKERVATNIARFLVRRHEKKLGRRTTTDSELGHEQVDFHVLDLHSLAANLEAEDSDGEDLPFSSFHEVTLTREELIELSQDEYVIEGNFSRKPIEFNEYNVETVRDELKGDAEKRRLWRAKIAARKKKLRLKRIVQKNKSRILGIGREGAKKDRKLRVRSQTWAAPEGKQLSPKKLTSQTPRSGRSPRIRNVQFFGSDLEEQKALNLETKYSSEKWKRRDKRQQWNNSIEMKPNGIGEGEHPFHVGGTNKVKDGEFFSPNVEDKKIFKKGESYGWQRSVKFVPNGIREHEKNIMSY